MSSTVEGLERGVIGTDKTIQRMHRLVALGKLDPTIQKIATWIRLGVPKDVRASTKLAADAIFNWVQKHGLFQRDPFQIEKIEHPIEAMRPIIEARKAGTYTGPALFVGDCDTMAGVYTASLLGVLGFQYSFETAKVDPDRPDEFSHVWVSARIGNEWYPLDPSTRGAYPGWRPPVKPEQFKRWPEGPIEDVVKGSDMSAFNSGMGDNGEDEGGDEPVIENNDSPLTGVDAEYAQDYIGYGIPRDFGSGPGVIPPGNFESLQLLPPHDTQIPAADLERDMHLLKAAPRLDPSERIQSLAGQPNDHGNPYYRGGGRQPYIKVERKMYPPGSRWNEPYGKDTIRYQKTDKYISVKSPETPERRVEVKMDQPMLIRRRNVMTPPQRIPFGAMDGMGDIDPNTGIMTFGSTPAPTATQTAAATAGTSVWDSILGAFSSVAKAAGTIVPSVLQSKTAQAVASATNRLAGSNVLTAGQLTNPTPWYKNPVTIGLGLATLGGLGYVVIKMRPGMGGRRRRR